MEVIKIIVEEVSIVCEAIEVPDVLDYCSQGRYTIVEVDPVRDGRSGQYTGKIDIKAVRPT